MAIGVGSNFFTPLNANIDVALTDKDNGNATLIRCTAANMPSAVAGYAVGCLGQATDSGANFVNTGSVTSATFTQLDTALAGAATSLVDSSQLTVVSTVHTATAVNNLSVQNSAAGAVSANAIILKPAGTDSAISLAIVPKGPTGIITLGAIDTTGAINVGIATTAATAGVNILSAAGVSSTQTVEIGGSTSATAGGKVVNIANGIPGVGTTNAVAIGTGGTTTGTVGVTLGSVGAAAHTTLIQGGNGTGASAGLKLAVAIAGDILIGAVAQTGDIIVGSSSGTQTVKLGNGAGISTINIANLSVVGANLNVATAATGAGITDTVAISTGNAAATGKKVVNILTGTPGTSGNNQLTMGGGVTSAVTINATMAKYLQENRVLGSAVANAPVGTLVDAAGNNVTVQAGLRIVLILQAGLQAGGNTLNLNGHGNDNIKMATAPANDLGTAYATGGLVDLMFNGTSWLAMAE